MKALLIILVASVGIAITVGLSALSFSNQVKRLENGIVAQYKENQNAYDNGWKTVVETAKVTDKQMAGLKDLFVSVTRGTYGDSGSNAFFQGMKERNIVVDQITFVRLQFKISSFRKTFAARQKDMISRCNTLDNLLTATTTGRLFNTFFNYPSIDTNKFCTVVTSTETSNAFETKQAAPLNF